MGNAAAKVVRAPVEQVYAEELAALAATDKGTRPAGWKLSPRAVRQFITGSDSPMTVEVGGKRRKVAITQKFYGDEALVERCIVTLLGSRGLLLVGEPGTAKSMLSELLACAISGTSMLTVQGTAGTTEDQIRYSWNYALLLAEGPSPRALVPSPLYQGMRMGAVVRFEELTRCQPEIQDVLVSLMSDKCIQVPELGGADGVVFAAKGFNLIGTANLRDRGVHEMSGALKRRFNFETVVPLSDKAQELALVRAQTEALLRDSAVEVETPEDVLDLLVTTFQDLRFGRTADGTVVEKPSTVMSTAEAVAVSHSAALEAAHFGNGRMEGGHVARQILGTILKDNPDDAAKLRNYFEVVAKVRGRTSAAWQQFYEARKSLRP